MFIHIGKNKSIRKKELIGVFDIETASHSQVTRDFMKKQEKKGRTESICFDLPKTLVLTDKKLYISPSTAESIKRRVGLSEKTENQRIIERN